MKSRQTRVDEGVERNTYWQSLSLNEKLKSLDNRLGVGVGARKQREKLKKLAGKS